MGQLKSCKICGKFFEPNGFSNACPDCSEKDETDFSRIRDYLYTHPLASIYEVATTLNITISKIKGYLREGRMEIADRENSFLTCTACGKAIQSGWYCRDCLRQISTETKSTSTNDSSQKSNNESVFRPKK